MFPWRFVIGDLEGEALTRWHRSSEEIIGAAKSCATPEQLSSLLQQGVAAVAREMRWIEEILVKDLSAERERDELPASIPVELTVIIVP